MIHNYKPDILGEIIGAILALAIPVGMLIIVIYKLYKLGHLMGWDK